MQVTEIRDISKMRSAIYLDGKFTFALYKGEVRTFGIREGEELPDSTLSALLDDILPKRAIKRAMNLLQKRDYTRKQLSDKLRQGGYPAGAVEAAISYVESYGYVDDERYALSFASGAIKDKSEGRIVQDLCRRGVDREIAARAVREAAGGEASCLEWEKAMDSLARKGFRPDSDSAQDRRKAYARACSFLARRGFSPDIVYPVLREYFAQSQERD